MKIHDQEHKGVKAPMTLHRRTQIADVVRQRGMAEVSELAALFGVSEVTIRKDLNQLEKEGRVTRDHGGAIFSGATSGASGRSSTVKSLLAIEERANLHIEEKRRIGQAAAQLVNPNDIIIMDAGTTVVEMAGHLTQITPLTVVTHALNVALEVGASDTEVLLLGGTFKRALASTLGPLTEQSLGELVVQKLFLGAQAVNLEDGLTDTTLEIAQVKRSMIRAARQVILLMDSSKWGCSGFIKVAPLTLINTIITDKNLPEDAKQTIERLNIELILV